MRKLPSVEPREIRSALAALMPHHELTRLVHRLDAVLLVGEGCDCGRVAAWLGVHRRTVERWVKAYACGGPQALGEPHPAGRPSRLDPAQLSQLAADLRAPPSGAGFGQPRWSGKLLRRYLDQRYGVALGVRQCQRLLRCTGSH